MSEQATCHKWEQFDGDSGSWQIVLGTGTGQLRYSVLWGYCPTCGSRLDADGTATEMAPVVTFANDNAGPVPCNQEWTKQRIEGLRILLEANGDHHMPPIDTGHVLSLLDALESAQALALQQVGPGHAAARHLLGESDEELLDVLERDAYTDDSGDIYIHLRSADIREAARALVAEQKEVPDGTEADSE